MCRPIGIVVPSYNQGKYLECTIKSILENRKHIDIKLVVIDGGSKDESVDIIKKYENEIDYWVSETDKGQADAINKGLKQMPDCEYYMWLNSDDVYDNETAVCRIVEYARKNKLQVCYGKSHYIDDSGKVIGDYPMKDYDFRELRKGCYLSQPSVLFSREAYLKVGELNVSLHMCMDYEYWIRLGRIYSFGYLQEYIGNTRIYGDTKTSTMRLRSIEEGILLVYHYYGTVTKEWTVARLRETEKEKNLSLLFKHIIVRLPGKIKNFLIRDMIKQFDFTIDYYD